MVVRSIDRSGAALSIIGTSHARFGAHICRAFLRSPTIGPTSKSTYIYGQEGAFDTIEPEDLKLSRKVFNHILSKHSNPSFQHINMNLDNKVAVITEKMTDKAKTFD